MKRKIGISSFIVNAVFGMFVIWHIVCLPGLSLAADDPILIGYLMPLTGPSATIGDISLKGAQLAVEKINAAGGIKSLGGRKIKLLVADTEAKPEVGVNHTQRLLRQPIVGFQGSYNSTIAFPATAVTEREKVPFLVSMAYSDPITQRGFKYTFRICTTNSLIAEDFVEFANELYKEFGVPLKTATTIMEDTVFGRPQTEAIVRVFKAKGINVIDTVFYPYGATNVASEIVRCKKANADAFIMHGQTSDAILLVKTMREMNFNPKAIICPGGAAKDASFLSATGKLAEYIYVINDTNWDVSEKAKSVNAEYRKRHGIDFTGLSYYEYVGVHVWKEVLEKAGSTDREKIRNTFATIEITNPEIMDLLPYDKIKFGPDGQSATVKSTMAMVKGGALRTVWPKKSASIKWVLPAPTWEEKLMGK